MSDIERARVIADKARHLSPHQCAECGGPYPPAPPDDCPLLRNALYAHALIPCRAEDDGFDLAGEIAAALAAERERARPVIEAARMADQALEGAQKWLTGRPNPSVAWDWVQEARKKLASAVVDYDATHPHDRASPGETEAG